MQNSWIPRGTVQISIRFGDDFLTVEHPNNMLQIGWAHLINNPLLRMPSIFVVLHPCSMQRALAALKEAKSVRYDSVLSFLTGPCLLVRDTATFHIRVTTSFGEYRADGAEFTEGRFPEPRPEDG